MYHLVQQRIDNGCGNIRAAFAASCDDIRCFSADEQLLRLDHVDKPDRHADDERGRDNTLVYQLVQADERGRRVADRHHGTCETRHPEVDRRGRAILCRVRVAPLTAEERDNVGMVIAFEDISEERRREEYTRYLGRIMGRALNEIYFLDPETLRFRLANHGAEVKLECNSQQLAQMTLADVMPDLDLTELKTLFDPLVRGEKPEIVFETTIRSRDGRHYPAELCVQYFGDETPRILVAMVHDTTERLRLDPA